MKRVSVLLVSAFLGLTIAGCDSGLQEAQPDEKAKGTSTTQFKSFMEQNSAKMQLNKGKPKDAPPAEKPAAK